MNLDVIVPLSSLVKHSVEDRIQNVNFGINQFYGKQIGVNIRMILVEQLLDNKDPLIIPQVKKEAYSKIKFTFDVIKYPKFIKGWCVNVGFNRVESDYFLISESDMWSPDSYFADMLDRAKRKDLAWMFAWNHLTYTGEAEKKLILKGMPLNGQRRWCQPKPGYSEGGLVLFKTEFYKKLGGFNEFFTQLGGIDTELMFRAAKRSGTYKKYPASVYHLFHPGVKKSNRPERLQNIIKIRQTRQAPGKVNEFLRGKQGDPEKPYCEKVKWIFG